MKVLITGGTGLIGRVLSQYLLEQGDEVTILSRSASPAGIPVGAQVAVWDGRTASGWGALVEQVDALINLAGESIGSSPWSPERRRRILDSRLNAGAAVTEAIRASGRKPRVLLQASAVGIYGPLQEEIAAEDSPLGNDFLANVAQRWEESTRAVEALGVRRVVTRSAIVLTRQGGILSNFELPVRLFVGGPLGSGKQWLPWVHIADEIGAMRFLLANDAASGVFNLCAPDVVRQGEFSRRLARTLGRPYWLPAPAFALKAALGSMSTLVLDGQHVVPQRLIQAGYAFHFPSLDAALADLYRK
jgi:uncharacterized protein (TIGR01777 family)